MYGRGYDPNASVAPGGMSAGLGAPGVSPGTAAAPSSGNTGGAGVVLTGLIILGVWVALSYLEFHQKVRESIQPRNVRVNLWNLFIITLTVAVGFTFVKWTLHKLVGFGLPLKSVLVFFDNV